MAKRILVIHHDDFDGWTAKLILDKYYGFYLENIPTSLSFYKIILNGINSDRVFSSIYILDLPIQEQYFENVSLEKLTVIDHHLSSKVISRNTFVYKVSSAARAVYMFLKSKYNFVDPKLDPLLKVADEIDSFKLTDVSKKLFMISAYLGYKSLYNYFYNNSLWDRDLELLYKISLELHNKEKEEIFKRSNVLNHNELNIFVTELPYGDLTQHTDKISLLCGELLKENDLVVIFGRYSVELRSKNIDVGRIAKIFNGGGHKYAAGFPLADSSFTKEKVLKKILQNISL